MRSRQLVNTTTIQLLTYKGDYNCVVLSIINQSENGSQLFHLVLMFIIYFSNTCARAMIELTVIIVGAFLSHLVRQAESSIGKFICTLSLLVVPNFDFVDISTVDIVIICVGKIYR